LLDKPKDLQLYLEVAEQDTLRFKYSPEKTPGLLAGR
jgi:hypothetical protein